MAELDFRDEDDDDTAPASKYHAMNEVTGDQPGSRYLDGDYLKANPDWHEADAPWKVRQIRVLLGQTGLRPRTICEVGAGTGLVLEMVARELPGAIATGFEISPEANEVASRRTRPGLSFEQGSPFGDERRWDLAMAIDVIEHVENPFAFARDLGRIATHQLLHIPLDMNALSVARGWPLDEARRRVGHIHYFNRATAIALLAESGLGVVAERYTPWAVDQNYHTWKKRLATVPRRMAFAAAPHATVRGIGGWSLLVLTRRANG